MTVSRKAWIAIGVLAVVAAIAVIALVASGGGARAAPTRPARPGQASPLPGSGLLAFPSVRTTQAYLGSGFGCGPDRRFSSKAIASRRITRTG